MSKDAQTDLTGSGRRSFRNQQGRLQLNVVKRKLLPGTFPKIVLNLIIFSIYTTERSKIH